MGIIDIQLKSYTDLQFEIMTLNTDKYLLQQKINKATESIKEDINYWQDSIYVELKAEDFIEILNKYLEILEGKDIEFDVLKALNTDTEDDIEMG